MVNAGILIPVKTLQVLLAYVDHLGKASSSALSILLRYSQRHRNVPHINNVQVLTLHVHFKQQNLEARREVARNDGTLLGIAKKHVTFMKSKVLLPT